MRGGGGISSLSSSSCSVAFSGSFFMPLGGGVFFLVDRTPWEDWTIRPLMVSTARGQYFDAFEYVSSGHVAKFSFSIDLSHVDLTVNHAVACMYRTSASMIGISYALCAEGVV